MAVFTCASTKSSSAMTCVARASRRPPLLRGCRTRANLRLPFRKPLRGGGAGRSARRSELGAFEIGTRCAGKTRRLSGYRFIELSKRRDETLWIPEMHVDEL